VVKDFKQKRSIDKVAAAMAKAVPMLLMQNADGESILHEYAALRAASEGADKRFMFVMSDGSPCSDGNAMEQYDLTKMAVKSIEQDPHTVIAGLGILDNNVEMFYSNNVVVDDVSNLSPALIQLVEGTIVRNV
jgi:cobalamin biosynthesis protein CobT